MPGRSRSVDGLRPRRVPQPIAASASHQAFSQPAASSAATAPAPTATQSAAKRSFAAPAHTQPRRHWWQRLAFPAAILACLCASFLVQSLPLGMAAIAVYAAVAWVRRLPSRYSFVMAFLSLATVILLLVVRQNVDLAGNFATYTFLLLVVGIVSSMFEAKTYKKRRKQ